MEFNYCRRCGKNLLSTSNGSYECANKHTIYVNPLPAVGIFFVSASNEVILSRRGIEPHKGMLDAFGGFVEVEETLEQAAHREIQEETNLSTEDYRPLNYLTSALGHYLYEGETLTVLSILFWAQLTTDKIISAFDDVEDVVKIPLNKVDPSQLHDDDIRAGIIELQQIFKGKSAKDNN